MAMIESSRGSALAAIPTAFASSEPPANEIEERTEEMPAEEPEDSEFDVEKRYATPKERLEAWVEEPNLARFLPYDRRQTIGMLVCREYEIDEQSRAEWKSDVDKAMKLALQKAEAKQYPWPKASNVIFPLVTSAALKFSAITYPALIPNRNLVRGSVWGSDNGTPATQDGKIGGAPKLDPNGQVVWLTPPGAKQIRADRVGQHMSWQFLEEMPEWEDQTDTGLYQMAIAGGFARKTGRDQSEQCNYSTIVPLVDLVWNRKAKNFDTAPRHTEIVRLYPDEIVERERTGTFLKIVYGASDAGTAEDGEGAPDPNDTLAPREFLEQHRRLDLDGDGYAEPLVVTVHRATQKVVRIVARFDSDKIFTRKDSDAITRIEPVEFYTLYPFLPDPEGGSYPVGFGFLLRPMNEGINTAINQMFDAGALANLGGGFYGTSLSLPSGPMNFQLGEYKPVNVKGQSIRDAVFPLPFPGPNTVLFQLLGWFVQAAKETASMTEILSGDSKLSETQPTTLMVLVEQGMKLYTAIHKRVYRSLKKEFAKLYRLNRLYLDGSFRFKRGDTWHEITADDYRLGGGVEPEADPNMLTDIQKVSRAGVLINFKDDPFCDPVGIRRRFFQACGVEKVDEILPQPKGPTPQQQMAMAQGQAELGRTRAAELKDQANALLFMAQARKLASEQEMGYFEAQLNLMRMHIEALNSQIKAADVDVKAHGHNVKMKIAQLQAEKEAANEPDGGAASESGGGGNEGAGLQPMAPPPGNGSGSMLPQTSGGVLPAGGP